MAMFEARGLEAGYGRARVLFGVSLEVRAGEVRLDGRRIDRLQTHEIARLGVAYVPEERRIFTDLTVAENIEVGRQAPRPGTSQWTLERLYSLFPALAPMQRRRAGSLSGGEQQMLCIARSLAGNPRAILLDEPSEGLAPLIVDQVARAIVELKQAGVAVLLAEQNRAFSRRVADRSYTLEKGRIADGQ